MRSSYPLALLLLLGCEEVAPEFAYQEWDAGALYSDACATFDSDRVYARVGLRCVGGQLLVPLDTPSNPVDPGQPRCVLDGEANAVIDPISQRMIYRSRDLREHKPKRIELRDDESDGSTSMWVVVGRDDDDKPAWADDPAISEIALRPDSREFLAYFDSGDFEGWHWSSAPRGQAGLPLARVLAALPGKLIFDVSPTLGMGLVDEHGGRRPIEGALQNENILAVRHHSGGLYIATTPIETDLTPLPLRLWNVQADGSYELAGKYARVPKGYPMAPNSPWALAPTGELFVGTLRGVGGPVQAVVRFGAPWSSDEPKEVLSVVPSPPNVVPRCRMASGPPKLDQLERHFGFVTGP